MAEGQEDRRIAPKGAHLPQVPLDDALPIARALRELAAPSTPQRIAHRINVAPSGGRFRARMASARYYGLIRQHGEKRELTELGERAVGDGHDADQALREAVLATGFRQLFSLLRGREANEELIRARLQDDYGVPVNASAGIAQALIESGQQAGLIAGGRFDTEAIEDALSASPVPQTAARVKATDGRPPVPTKHPASERSQRAEMPPTPATPVTTGRQSPDVHIDIQIHIPATASGEQIDQIFASMAKHLYGRD